MRYRSLLLERGADINTKCGTFNDAPFQAAILSNDEDNWRSFMNYGADIKDQDGKYGIALQLAAFEGIDSAVQLCLDLGA